jgi:phosphate transport system substrate-binding protein
MAATACLRALLLVVLVAACGEPVATPEPVFLRAGGSMVMGPLVADLATAFRERNPTVNLEVESLDPLGGLGTGFALDALRRGEIDLALASWYVPGTSGSSGLAFEPGWQATAVARDGIAIIVHPDNPLEGVGLLQLRDIFRGRSSEWRAVTSRAGQGLVQPVSREDGSGTRAAFEALVMEDLAVTPRALVAPSGHAVVKQVAQDPQAIGYISMSEVTPQVKVLKIEGLLPTPENVGLGSYPLTRELWLVAPTPVDVSLSHFVKFALSPAGQQVVGQRFGRIH